MSPNARGLREPTVATAECERKRFIIETNGAGVALVDYDNDGWLDALILSGTRLKDGTRDAWSTRPARRRPTASIATCATARSRT